MRESQRKRKRATAQEEIAAEAAEAEEADASGPAAKKSRYDAGRAVVMYILDPENATHHPRSDKMALEPARSQKKSGFYTSNPSTNYTSNFLPISPMAEK